MPLAMDRSLGLLPFDGAARAHLLDRQPPPRRAALWRAVALTVGAWYDSQGSEIRSYTGHASRLVGTSAAN